MKRARLDYTVVFAECCVGIYSLPDPLHFTTLAFSWWCQGRKEEKKYQQEVDTRLDARNLSTADWKITSRRRSCTQPLSLTSALFNDLDNEEEEKKLCSVVCSVDREELEQKLELELEQKLELELELELPCRRKKWSFVPPQIKSRKSEPQQTTVLHDMKSAVFETSVCQRILMCGT
ncbi:hypothetical protein AOLI_G00188890 [Acnodon oligacanthus]